MRTCMCMCTAGARDRVLCAADPRSAARENGFFYDSYLGGGSYSESMKATVEKKVAQTH